MSASKKSTSVKVTANQELPNQYVMDFFNQGIPITQAPKDVVVKKSNAAIKMISSLGLLELKIIDACYYVARPNMIDKALHSVDMEYFKWLLSFDSKNKEHLKRSITKIQQTLIQINTLDVNDPDKDFWFSTPFLYDVSITQNRIFFRIPEGLHEPLVNPRSWTYLSFRIKNIFTSEYAYRLYERCRADQYKNATDWWGIDEFRLMMNASNQYPKFQDLNKRVIKMATDQINDHSDIYVTPDYQTRGREKTHIRFLIETNPNVETMTDDKNMPADVYETLKKEFGFSNSEIEKVAEYDLHYLAEKIDFARYRIKTSKTKIGRPNLYLLSVLREDLRFNTGEIANFEKEEQIQKSLQIKNDKHKAENEDIKKSMSPLDQFFKLPENEQELIVDEFKSSPYFDTVRAGLGRKKFSLDSLVVKAELLKFLNERGGV